MLTGNLFRTISLVLAASAFIKVFFGIFYHDKLYGWAKKHYSQDKRSLAVNLLLIYALVLLLVVWYATLTQYVPLGWILTLIITSASVKSIGILLNWKLVSEKFAEFIVKAEGKLWMVDLFVGILGVLFLYLALVIY